MKETKIPEGYLFSKPYTNNIQTALSVLTVALLMASVMFFTGSFYYERDLAKVEQIKLESI